MPVGSITVLTGGLGGARLALALQAAGLEWACTFITNVADDVEFGDLVVCPDTDAVLYALAGRFDEERGWGVRGDVFEGPPPGAPPWFNIGREDAELHRRRSSLLTNGLTLAEATTTLAAELGLAARVLPVTNDPVRTKIRNGDSQRAFQEWLVRDHCDPAPDAVEWPGIDATAPAPGVVDAIRDADVVVIASSSPIASIKPLISVPGVCSALRERGSRRTLALSPVAARRPLTTERDRRRAHARAALLDAFGIGHDPLSVAELYAPFIDTFVLDTFDAEDAGAVRALGLDVLVAPVVASTPGERRELCAALPLR